MRQNSPKVLIIGVAPGEKSGSGITLKNLFNKFSKEEIACIVPYADSSAQHHKYCSVYQLGDREEFSRLPISRFKKKLRSGTPTNNKADFERVKKNRLVLTIQKLGIRILILSGLNHILYEYKLSPELRHFIDKFSPDVIYCQLASVEMIRLVAEIKKNYKLPLVIHTMDDWPNTINRPNLLYFYWRYKINQEFRNLINQSARLMSICDAMSKEYQARYHRKFEAFHNPVDTRFWDKFAKKSYNLNNPIRMIYFGAINTMSNYKSIVKISKIVDQINSHGINLKFDVYSFQQIDRVKKFKNVLMHPPVEHKTLPKLVPQYDFCIIPVDNTPFTNKFAKFSMPTKATECMISGVPTIIFANKETAVSKSAKKYQWGVTLEDINMKSLKEAMDDLVASPLKRKNLAKNAIIFAKKNFDLNSVSTKFKDSIIKISNKHNEKK